MENIAQRILAARQSGFSDDEIVKALSSGGDISQAAAAGDFSAAEILAAVMEKNQRSTGESAARQIGLTARAGAPVAAGAGLGFMVGGPLGAGLGALTAAMGPSVIDPFINIANEQFDSSIPTTGQAIESLMSKVGFPEPENQQERIVQDVARAMAGGGGSAKAFQSVAGAAQSPTAVDVLTKLAQYPAQQTAASGLASGAASTAREQGVGALGQLGLGMAAGMVAPGGPRTPLTATPIAAAKATVQPFTQAGREVIAGNVLNRLATNPEMAAQRMAQAQPLVKGVQPTAAAAAFDPGIAASETALRSAFDVSGQFPNRLSANQQALLKEFQRVAGSPAKLQSAKDKRSSITAPMRESAFASGQPVAATPVQQAIEATLANPASQRKIVGDAMSEVSTLLAQRVDPETGLANPMSLYSLRKDINDMIGGKYGKDQATFKQAQGELLNVQRVLDDVIESGAPGYKDYMSRFAQMSTPVDQMRTLQAIEGRVTTGQPNLITGDPVLAASALRRQLQQNQEQIFKMSAPVQKRLDNIITEINRGQAATAPGVKVPGSDTFKNMSMANFLGKIFSESMATNTTLKTMARPLDFLYRIPDEQLQTLIVEASLDPKLAASLMGKANVMSIDSMAKSLRNKAEQLGYGTYIGTTQGQ